MPLSFVSSFSRVFSRPAPKVSTSARRGRFLSSARTADSARVAIASENVMIFSTTYCPFCAQVKALFSHLDVKHQVWELDQLEQGQLIRDFLLQETGQRTVPNVFVGGKHIGGCDDTMLLHEQGKLLDLVNAGGS